MATAELTELFGLLERQTELVSQLVNSSEASLQSRNVIGSPNSTFGAQQAQPTTLTSREKRRLILISDVFINEFFKEQQKHQKDTAEKTKIDKISKPLGQKMDFGKFFPKPQEKGGLLSSLLSALGSALGLDQLFDGKFSKPIVRWLLKRFLPKGGAKAAAKAAQEAAAKATLEAEAKAAAKTGEKAVTEGVLKGATKTGESAVESAVKSATKMGTSAAAKSTSGAATESAIEGAVKGATNMGATPAVQAAETGGKGFFSRTWDFIKGGGKAVLEEGAEVSSKGMLNGMFKNLLKSGVKTTLIKAILGNALLNGLVEAGFRTWDILGKKKEYEDGTISLKDFQTYVGKQVSDGIIVAITGAVGAGALGTLGGAIGGPLGAWVFGTAGNVLGSMAGEWLAEKFDEHVFVPEYQQVVGEKVLNLFASKKEMQDFIFSQGQAYPFNSKDELIGMKDGGALDKLISSIGMVNQDTPQLSLESLPQVTLQDFMMDTNDEKGKNILADKERKSFMNSIMNSDDELNDHMKSISMTNSKMIEYLNIIAQHTAIIAKNASHGSAPIVSAPIISNPTQTDTFSKYDATLYGNRKGYSNSVYALE